MDTGDISREQAAEALATIEESRGLVQAERERAKRGGRHYAWLVLGVLTPIAGYSSIDLIGSRAKRWALGAGWQVAVFALGLALQRGRPVVSRMPVFRPESSKRYGRAALAAITGMAVVERVVVLVLRRSRLRRPNIVAGFVVAGLRTGFRVFLLNRIIYAGQPGDEPAAPSDGRLHRALLLPDTLRIAALLGGGEILDLAFVCDTFGIDRLDLAEDLQPLFDAKLATSTTSRDSAQVFLTPDGRDAFAQHLRALHDRAQA
jgi:hypothetical protein